MHESSVNCCLELRAFIYCRCNCFLLQFFADADDVDTWMLDTLRLVSSEDVGHDEASAQSLVKKHKVSEALFCYPITN